MPSARRWPASSIHVCQLVVYLLANVFLKYSQHADTCTMYWHKTYRHWCPVPGGGRQALCTYVNSWSICWLMCFSSIAGMLIRIQGCHADPHAGMLMRSDLYNMAACWCDPICTACRHADAVCRSCMFKKTWTVVKMSSGHRQSGCAPPFSKTPFRAIRKVVLEPLCVVCAKNCRKPGGDMVRSCSSRE